METGEVPPPQPPDGAGGPAPNEPAVPGAPQGPGPPPPPGYPPPPPGYPAPPPGYPPPPPYPPPPWGAYPPPPPGYPYYPPPPGYAPYGAYPGWNAAQPPTVGHGRYRARGVAELVDAAFTLYRRNFVLITAIVAIAQVPYAVLHFVGARVAGIPSLTTAFSAIINNPNHVATVDNRTEVQLATALLTAVQTVIIGPVVLAAVALAVSNLYRDRAANIGDSYRSALRRLIPILTVGLILGLIAAPELIASVTLDPTTPPNPTADQVSTAGQAAIVILLFLIVSGIGQVLLALAVPAAVNESGSGLRAIGRSWQLVRGAFWRTVGVLLLLGVLVAIVTLIAYSILDLPGHALSGDASLAVDVVAQAVATIIASPISMITVTLLYFDRRIRREAFDLEMLASTL